MTKRKTPPALIFCCVDYRYIEAIQVFASGCSMRIGQVGGSSLRKSWAAARSIRRHAACLPVPWGRQTGAQGGEGQWTVERMGLWTHCRMI